MYRVQVCEHYIPLKLIWGSVWAHATSHETSWRHEKGVPARCSEEQRWESSKGGIYSSCGKTCLFLLQVYTHMQAWQTCISICGNRQTLCWKSLPLWKVELEFLEQTLFYFKLCCKPMPGFPGGLVVKESSCQYRRLGFDPGVRKIPWRRKWQPTPIFFPGKSHGQRSLAGYSP